MNYEEIIKTNYRKFHKFSTKDIYDIVTKIIEHYRITGYPYFVIDKSKIKKEYNALMQMDISNILLPNNELEQSMIGLNSCNSFHPEMISVRCKSKSTPMNTFLDDKLFRIALTKRIKYDNGLLNDSYVRRALTAFGTQAVSNFRPSVAKWVYQKYCPPGGDVLDPCAGYGGRLFGAFCSHISSYTGIDPSEKSHTGNINLYNHLIECYNDDTLLYKNNAENLKQLTLEFFTPRKYPDMRFENIPFEDYNSTKKYDLVFTSPPYFNIEKYSEEPTQSYIRYPKYSDWRDNFLKVLIENSYNFLKPGGFLALNVGTPINKDTLKIGNNTFKNTPEIYYMRLSKFLGSGNKKTTTHKLEPVFIWRK